MIAQAMRAGLLATAIATLWLRAADDWGIIGQFMYRAHAYQRLLDLLRSGLLDIRAIRPRVYPLAALPEAMEAAATAGSL